MVSVCLHGMSDEYQVFLENLTLSSFSKLMEASRRTNESTRRTPKSNRTVLVARTFRKKRQIVAAVEGSSKEGSSSKKKPTHKLDHKHKFKLERKPYPPLPPLPCSAKKAVALLKQWVNDPIVQLPLVSQAPTQIDERNPNFCPYHCRRGHTLDQCVMFRRIFDKKLEDGEIIL